MSSVIEDDIQLVARSIAGQRSAFEQIVTRHQSAVCAVAYSAMGNLQRSEDVAQETFITAWRQLDRLRDPARLRAWLCGIARNVALSAWQRETVHAECSIEDLSSPPKDESAQLLDRAIRDEEHAMLWRAIGAMSPLYREPLVLFYREQCSIEEVAATLEVSSDVVRQRLSRGRKLLQADIVALVERTLTCSVPGKGFTLAVMASLPALGLVPTTTAAATGLGAIPGSIASKSVAASAFLGLAGPAIGAVSLAFSLRTGLEAASSASEKRLVIRQTIELVAGALLFAMGLCALVFQGPRLGDNAALLLAIGLALSTTFAVWLVPTVVRGMRAARRLRASVGGPSTYRDIRSKTTWLGWPLYHVRLGAPPIDAPSVRGWVALGDRSIGLVFAMGYVAVAPISLGVISIGVVSVGGLALGVIPMASVALGVLPIGGAVFGMLAIGGFAVGAFGAVGGLALSLGHAGGRFAIAPHANDAIAFGWLSTWLPPYVVPMLIVLMAVLAIVPVVVYGVVQRRHLDGAGPTPATLR